MQSDTAVKFLSQLARRIVYANASMTSNGIPAKHNLLDARTRHPKVPWSRPLIDYMFAAEDVLGEFPGVTITRRRLDCLYHFVFETGMVLRDELWKLVDYELEIFRANGDVE